MSSIIWFLLCWALIRPPSRRLIIAFKSFWLDDNLSKVGTDKLHDSPCLPTVSTPSIKLLSLGMVFDCLSISAGNLCTFKRIPGYWTLSLLPLLNWTKSIAIASVASSNILRPLL